MEQVHNPVNPFEAVAELQLRHKAILEGSSVLKKIVEFTRGNEELHETVVSGWPSVLGSNYEGVRHIFIAFREQSSLFEESKVRSRYFTIGSCIGDAVMPTARFGLTDEDFYFVDKLFDEAVVLRDTVAPGYSLESGLIKE